MKIKRGVYIFSECIFSPKSKYWLLYYHELLLVNIVNIYVLASCYLSWLLPSVNCSHHLFGAQSRSGLLNKKTSQDFKGFQRQSSTGRKSLRHLLVFSKTVHNRNIKENACKVERMVYIAFKISPGLKLCGLDLQISKTKSAKLRVQNKNCPCKNVKVSVVGDLLREIAAQMITCAEVVQISLLKWELCLLYMLTPWRVWEKKKFKAAELEILVDEANDPEARKYFTVFW